MPKSPRRSSRPVRVLRELVAIYWSSGVSDDVPALAWFLLASLVPLALGLTALAAVLLGDYSQAQAVAEHVAQFLPKDVHDQVVELILRTHRDSPLLIAVSIAIMVWTVSGAVGVMSRCLSRLLDLPGSGIVVGKLRNLGVTAAVTTLIVLLVVVATAGTGLVGRLHIDHLLIRVAIPLVSIGVAVGMCAGIYMVLTGGRVRKRAALAGGLVAAVILEVTPIAAGYYLRYVAGATPVALFLMFTGVLITCYLAALGLLLGAAVTARIQLGQRLDATPEGSQEPATEH